jgi:hypothetical protein
MRLARGHKEQGGTDGVDATPAVGEPSKSWGAMFDEQCSVEMLRRVRRYARRVASSIAEAGGLGGESCADELLQDCVTDTISGVLVWDPAITMLEHHLMARIRSRGRDERHRVLQHPHRSIDAVDGEGEDSAALDEAEQALLSSRDEAAERYATARLALMREHAATDPDLQAILDAADNGAEGKAEILAASGLTEKAYRNARLRLRRLGDRALSGIPTEDAADEANA